MKYSHNDYTPAQLEQIITTVRERCGKATLKLVSERIGRSTTYVWYNLDEAGLPTRLLSESLATIQDKIETDAPHSTLTELYERHGSLWASPESFKRFLLKRHIKHLRRPTTAVMSYATLFGREGLLDDTKKTDIEIKRAAELDALNVDNNPTKLHKPSWEVVKHKLS